MLAQARQRAALVPPHQAGVADNVGSEDRRQFALLHENAGPDQFGVELGVIMALAAFRPSRTCPRARLHNKLAIHELRSRLEPVASLFNSKVRTADTVVRVLTTTAGRSSICTCR